MPNETICTHTPGPWEARVFKSKDGFGIFAECRKGEFGERSLASANFFENLAYTGFFNQDETEANARLIAAAPEQHSWMWTALTALRYWRDSETNKDKYAELCKLISDGEDIYHEAEGR